MSISKEKPHVGIVDKVEFKFNHEVGYYIIENNERYFVHLGDIEANEKRLYSLRDQGLLETLKEKDKVEFEPFEVRHAIHVKKVT